MCNFCLSYYYFVARGSKSHTSDADDQMVIDNTQVFDGEDMAASFSNSNINGNNHTSNNTSAATAVPPVGAAVSSSSSFIVPSRSSSRIRASQPNPTSSQSSNAKEERYGNYQHISTCFLGQCFHLLKYCLQQIN